MDSDSSVIVGGWGQKNVFPIISIRVSLSSETGILN